MFYLDKAGEKSDSSSSDSKGTVKGDDSNSEEAAFNSHVNVRILYIRPRLCTELASSAKTASE